MLFVIFMAFATGVSVGYGIAIHRMYHQLVAMRKEYERLLTTRTRNPTE